MTSATLASRLDSYLARKTLAGRDQAAVSAASPAYMDTAQGRLRLCDTGTGTRHSTFSACSSRKPLRWQPCACAEITRFDDCGHFPEVEQSERYAQLLKAHVDKLSANADTAG